MKKTLICSLIAFYALNANSWNPEIYESTDFDNPYYMEYAERSARKDFAGTHRFQKPSRIGNMTFNYNDLGVLNSINIIDNEGKTEIITFNYLTAPDKNGYSVTMSWKYKGSTKVYKNAYIKLNSFGDAKYMRVKDQYSDSEYFFRYRGSGQLDAYKVNIEYNESAPSEIDVLLTYTEENDISDYNISVCARSYSNAWADDNVRHSIGYNSTSSKNSVGLMLFNLYGAEAELNYLYYAGILGDPNILFPAVCKYDISNEEVELSCNVSYKWEMDSNNRPIKLIINTRTSECGEIYDESETVSIEW